MAHIGSWMEAVGVVWCIVSWDTWGTLSEIVVMALESVVMRNASGCFVRLCSVV